MSAPVGFKQFYEVLGPNLHTLLISLSREEKRKLKLAVRQSGNSGSNYVRVFHALATATKYDENAICDAVKLKPAQLYAAFRYLGLFIAKLLVTNHHEPHSNISVESASKMLEYGLVEVARIILKKGIREAEENEQFDTLYQLLGLARRFGNENFRTNFLR